MFAEIEAGQDKAGREGSGLKTDRVGCYDKLSRRRPEKDITGFDRIWRECRIQVRPEQDKAGQVMTTILHY